MYLKKAKKVRQDSFLCSIILTKDDFRAGVEMNQNRENVKKVLGHIENNLQEPMTLPELAGRAFLSEFYFHRLFREMTGKPVMEYIRGKRLEKAAEELTGTEETVLELALKYRFNSPESFTRAFKRVYGMAPSEYRKQAVASARKTGRFSGGNSISMCGGMAA